MAFAFYLPSKNYAGSSGYSASGKKLTTTPSYLTTKQSSNSSDYPIYDPTTGKYISYQTGQPFTGKDPWQGNSYSGGVLQAAASSTPEATGDPNKDYAAVNIEKSPELASATQDLLKTFEENAQKSLTGFDEYLKNFQTDLESARTKNLAAEDTSATEAALTAAQQKYTGQLDASRAAYEQALADAASAQRGVVGQATDTLGDYDKAIDTLRNLQTGAVQANLNRYKLRTGTPTSHSGAESQILAKAMYEAAAPFEMAKVNKRYDILSGMALPVESAIGGANVAYAGNFLPSIAGAEYGSASGVAQYLQSLRQAVAGMSLSNANAYLVAAGLPDSIRQQVLSGYTQNLGGIAGLYPSAYYQGLNYLPGVETSQPVYYSANTGGYPSGLSRMPSGTSFGGQAASNASFPFYGPSAPGSTVFGSNGLGYGTYGAGTSVANNPARTGRGLTYTGGYTAGDEASSGVQTGAVYNPITMQVVDPITRQAVGQQSYANPLTSVPGIATDYALSNLF